MIVTLLPKYVSLSAEFDLSNLELLPKLAKWYILALCDVNLSCVQAKVYWHGRQMLLS